MKTILIVSTLIFGANSVFADNEKVNLKEIKENKTEFVKITSKTDELRKESNAKDNVIVINKDKPIILNNKKNEKIEKKINPMKLVKKTKNIIYKDCKTILKHNNQSKSGKYTIDPDGLKGSAKPFVVYCDMTTNGGGWTKIGERKNFFKEKGKNEVLINNLIPMIPQYTEVIQPNLIGRECMNCNENFIKIEDEKGDVILKLENINVKDRQPYNIYSSDTFLIYKGTWSNWNDGTDRCGGKSGIGHYNCLTNIKIFVR